MPLLIMASMFLLNKAHLYTDLHTHQKNVFTAWMGKYLWYRNHPRQDIAEQQASQMPIKTS